jgi:hypothetical protein
MEIVLPRRDRSIYVPSTFFDTPYGVSMIRDTL